MAISEKKRLTFTTIAVILVGIVTALLLGRVFLSGTSRGKSLAVQNGCTNCHSVDGTSLVGPTWKGLFGKEETLADGSTVQVDEAYLRESIVDSDVKIVKGFTASVMPGDFGQKLSDSDIQVIIEYIKTLK